MVDRWTESGEAVLWGSLVAASFLSSYTLLEHSFHFFFPSHSASSLPFAFPPPLQTPNQAAQRELSSGEHSSSLFLA